MDMETVLAYSLALPSVPTIVAFSLCLYRVVRLEHRVAEQEHALRRLNDLKKESPNAEGL